MGFMEESREVKEDHAWCLGVDFSVKDQEASAPKGLCVLSPSPLSHALSNRWDLSRSSLYKSPRF